MSSDYDEQPLPPKDCCRLSGSLTGQVASQGTWVDSDCKPDVSTCRTCFQYFASARSIVCRSAKGVHSDLGGKSAFVVYSASLASDNALKIVEMVMNQYAVPCDSITQ